MKEPLAGLGSVQNTTMKRNDDIDRQIEAALDKIVHDSPYNFRTNEEGDKTLSQIRRGVPRHEW
jgi:hypothetical protein